MLGCQQSPQHIKHVKVHRYTTKDKEYLYIMYSRDELKYYSYTSPVRVTNFKNINFNYYRGIPKVGQEEEVEEILMEDLSDDLLDDMEEGDFDVDTVDTEADASDGSGDSGGDSGGDGGD